MAHEVVGDVSMKAEVVVKGVTDGRGNGAKGDLMYRNVYLVRCSFEGAEEQEQ